MPSPYEKLRSRLTSDVDAWNHPRRAALALGPLGFVAAVAAVAVHSAVLVHRGIDVDPTLFTLAGATVGLLSGYVVLALLD